MTDVVFGGDINLFSVEKGTIPRIDETKLTASMNNLKVENGGSISSFTFNTGPVRRQMQSPGEDQIKEFIKGDGLVWGRSKIGNIYSQAVDRNLV